MVDAVDAALNALASYGVYIDENLAAATDVASLVTSPGTEYCGRSYNHDGMTRFLASALAPGCPITTPGELLASGLYRPSESGFYNTYQWLVDFVDFDTPPSENYNCSLYETAKAVGANYLVELMDSRNLTGIVFPMFNRLPTLLTPDPSDPLNIPVTFLSASTGLPSVTFPVAYSGGDDVPIAVGIVGRPYSEVLKKDLFVCKILS